MNYIKLLNAAFEKFYFDERLNPAHISLYMALFQEWNSCRFANEFFVNRRDLMQLAKIGSKSTYHRCITNLHSWNYLLYFPSNNPFKGSKIKMTIILPSDETVSGDYDPILELIAEQYRPNNEQVIDTNSPISGQALVSYINNTKQININKQPKDRKAVIIFFKEKGSNADEGKRFLEYYDSHEWHTGDGQPVRDWQALAESWIERSETFKKENLGNKKTAIRKDENLKTTKNKNYGKPL